MKREPVSLVSLTMYLPYCSATSDGGSTETDGSAAMSVTFTRKFWTREEPLSLSFACTEAVYSPGSV